MSVQSVAMIMKARLEDAGIVEVQIMDPSDPEGGVEIRLSLDEALAPTGFLPILANAAHAVFKLGNLHAGARWPVVIQSGDGVLGYIVEWHVARMSAVFTTVQACFMAAIDQCMEAVEGGDGVAQIAPECVADFVREVS